MALLAALGVAALGVAAFVLLLTDPNGRAWIWTLAAAMVVMFAVLAAARWGSRPGR